MDTYAYTCRHTCIHTDSRAYIYIYICACAHADTYFHVHIHTQKDTDVHRDLHVCASLSLSLSLFLRPSISLIPRRFSLFLPPSLTFPFCLLFQSFPCNSDGRVENKKLQLGLSPGPCHFLRLQPRFVRFIAKKMRLKGLKAGPGLVL